MSFFDWIGKILSEYFLQFLKGTGYTLVMAIAGTLIGFIIGLAIAVVRTIPTEKGTKPVKRVLLKIVNVILNVYIEVMRGTPMLVQALIIHYSLFAKMNM